MVSNCGAGKDSWVSPGLQAGQAQSILKEINPKYSLEELILKLKLQYFGHQIWRARSLEKTLVLGKTEGKKKKKEGGVRGWEDNITDSMNKYLSKLQEIVKDRGTSYVAIHTVTKSWTWLSHWSATKTILHIFQNDLSRKYKSDHYTGPSKFLSLLIHCQLECGN